MDEVTTNLLHPGVSVVVPCFNQASYLLECLQSVAAQTYPRWEAIVVDDASTVGDVRQVVSQMKDSRFRVLRHGTNRGLGAARNTGIRDARAKWVLPLDSDDRLDPSFLAATVARASEDECVDCVFTDFQLFGSSTGVWRNSPYNDLRSMLLRQQMPGAGALMRRDLWVEIGGYAEDVEILGNEDWDFWISAAERGARTAHVSQALYMYRRHADSMSEYTLRYRDADHRELIYRRHRASYDDFRVAGEFRGVGYANSAVFALAIGEPRRAAVLAWQGLRVPGGALPFLRAAVLLGVRGVFARLRRLSSLPARTR